MRTLTGRVFCALALACLACAAASAQTQLELNGRACAEYKKADAELNRVYEQVLGEYKSDAKFVGRLRLAQRAWLAYRDAHLAAMYPEEDKRLAYGSAFPMCYCMAQEEVTRARTEVLRKWAEGAEEGDVCGGSIKVREGGAAGSRGRAPARRRG